MFGSSFGLISKRSWHERSISGRSSNG